jgi:predicted XRE-type DNA-binding protein
VKFVNPIFLLDNYHNTAHNKYDTHNKQEVAMDSPLSRWMKGKEITQGQFASLAGVDRTEVCRMASGEIRGARKLRVFVEELDPKLLKQQDAFHRTQVDAVREKVMAA